MPGRFLVSPHTHGTLHTLGTAVCQKQGKGMAGTTMNSLFALISLAFVWHVVWEGGLHACTSLECVVLPQHLRAVEIQSAPRCTRVTNKELVWLDLPPSRQISFAKEVHVR